MDINKWMVSEKIAKNIFNANHIFVGLELSKISDEKTRMARCKNYREWRRAGENAKAAYARAINSEIPPPRIVDIETAQSTCAVKDLDISEEV